MDLEALTCLGRRTLIVGDVNTGKTTLTRQILQQFSSDLHLRHQIILLDLSPTVPLTLSLPESKKGVGGRVLTDPIESGSIDHLCPDLLPPRLVSRDEAEAMAIARSNLQQINDLLSQQNLQNRSILLINDITLYLHAGEARDLIQWMAPANTVVANGYLGTQLGEGTLSAREREQMKILMQGFDQVTVLPQQEPTSHLRKERYP